MKTLFRRSGGFGVMATVLIFSTVAMAHWLGAFRHLDDWFADACQRQFAKSSGNQRVLLVYASDALLYSTDGRLIRLCEILLDDAPGGIGIIAEKPLPSAGDLAEQPWSNRLVIGVPIAHCFDADVRRPAWQTGYIDLLLADQSVYRRHWARLEAHQRTVDSLERVLARQAGLPERELPNGVFGIHYSAGVDGLPHIDAEEVLQGKLVSELVRNRVVLIGSRQGNEYGWVTPTTRGAQRMSRLELHGNILESILEQNELRSLGGSWTGIWLAWLALLSVQTFRQCSQRWLPRLWGLGSLALVALAGVWLVLLNRQLPLAASLALLTMAAGVALFQRFAILDQAAAFWQLMLNVNDVADADSDPERVWDLITDAVYQMFSPKRMALMELSPHATHLKIVKTIHCQPENIYEQRRDIQRPPYRDAVDCGRPIRIANRCFFNDQVQRGETEFMVPLVFAAQPLGFMVLGMDTASLDRWKDFDSFLEQFAREMSILVANDRASKREAEQQKRILGRLRQVPEESTLASIQHQHVGLQGEFQRIANTFEIAESAIAICDVFGQIVRANSQMISLLQRAAASVSDTNCIEMISALTGRSEDDCRQIFRTAIISKRPGQVFIPSGRLRPYSCVLFIKPLLVRTNDFEGEIETRRVVIEVVEERVFHWIHRWQQQIQQRVSGRAIETVQRLESELSTPPRTAELGTGEMPYGAAIQSTLKELTQVLADCRAASELQLNEDPNNVIELDVWGLAEGVQERVLTSHRHREIDCQSRTEGVGFHVVANPLLLERLLTAIWEILVRNMHRHSTVVVSGLALDDQVMLEFVSQGGESPIETLRKSLENSAPEPDDSISSSAAQLVLSRTDQERLSQVRECLDCWGGILRGRARADGGLHFQLVLQRNGADRGPNPVAPNQLASGETHPNEALPSPCLETSGSDGEA